MSTNHPNSLVLVYVGAGFGVSLGACKPHYPKACLLTDIRRCAYNPSVQVQRTSIRVAWHLHSFQQEILPSIIDMSPIPKRLTSLKKLITRFVRALRSYHPAPASSGPDAQRLRCRLLPPQWSGVPTSQVVLAAFLLGLAAFTTSLRGMFLIVSKAHQWNVGFSGRGRGPARAAARTMNENEKV